MSADGYALTVCSCDGGPYLGARKAGTPCCCEVCGFITPDQLAAIAEALGSSDDGLRERVEALAAESDLLGRHWRGNAAVLVRDLRAALNGPTS